MNACVPSTLLESRVTTKAFVTAMCRTRNLRVLACGCARKKMHVIRMGCTSQWCGFQYSIANELKIGHPYELIYDLTLHRYITQPLTHSLTYRAHSSTRVSLPTKPPYLREYSLRHNGHHHHNRITVQTTTTTNTKKKKRKRKRKLDDNQDSSGPEPAVRRIFEPFFHVSCSIFCSNLSIRTSTFFLSISLRLFNFFSFIRSIACVPVRSWTIATWLIISSLHLSCDVQM